MFDCKFFEFQEKEDLSFMLVSFKFDKKLKVDCTQRKIYACK